MQKKGEELPQVAQEEEQVATEVENAPAPNLLARWMQENRVSQAELNGTTPLSMVSQAKLKN